MERIKFYRGKMGLSQKELAEKVGIDRHWLSSLEGRNNANVSKKTAIKMAEVLGVSFFELVGLNALRYRPTEDADRIVLAQLLYEEMGKEAQDEFKKRLSGNEN